jgi:hypothetical protein
VFSGNLFKNERAEACRARETDIEIDSVPFGSNGSDAGSLTICCLILPPEKYEMVSNRPIS